MLTSRILQTRRRFLLSAGAVMAAAALPELVLANVGGESRLVVVVLRGALDGLAAAPPHGDRDYADLHRELAIAPPGVDGGALPLDDTFGLHPSLRFLHERFAAEELVVFHAVASPYRDRSHFDGQNVLENGLTVPVGTADGWLNRALASLPASSARDRLERAVAISQNVPLILRGPAPVLSKSPLATPDIDDDLVGRLADLYSKDDWFAAQFSAAVQGEKLTNEGGGMATPSGQSRIGSIAQMAATLMSSTGGPEVAVIEATGWDTHANQGGAHGLLAQRLGGLDDALRVLHVGLGSVWSKTAVLVVTEFGRTAAMNGTRGTDHGTGGCAFLVGGAVRGGRVVADWPGLGQSALLDKRDLKPTLDLRSVFKGVLNEHMQIDAGTLTARIFPDSKGARPLKGLMRA
jgi:uncharacterized protein (DUF1501 family)